ncbi:hypothetical protein CFAM422_004463 [Trichoderma lentiforme]|uniref:Uncharacterized protein n=1 Tax=Trichoderma lentiforme TaxID=1567552 RepID=A0A9P5CFG7_9HYPO|nr:hypothetical protein CFAM422_004463 [Trichoderma lentiforme]
MAPSSATSGALFSPASLNLPRPSTRDRDHRDRDRDKDKDRGRDRDRDRGPPDNSSSSLSAVRSSSKERKASFSSLKASLPGSRRRNAANAANNAANTDTGAPAVPDLAQALAAAAKIVSKDSAIKDKEREKEREKERDQEKDSRRDAIEGPRVPFSPPEPSMISRAATVAAMVPPPATPVEARPGMSSTMWALAQGEAHVLHQQITETAQKRVSTLDYLRKAHEGRVYWFNTYLFDKPDLSRMPSFDPRKLSRKATNYLLLGLSIPTIHDLYSSTPLEFLRCLNALLAEFDSFQQLHGDSSTAALTRARIPNMFRRPGTKTRRSTSADVTIDDSSASGHHSPAGGSNNAGPAPAVMNFAASESDLLPGEEYTYLLTPSLPFDPDFFETFATLCDVLIDCYTRFLALVPSPRECSAPIAELFTKADSKIRKIIVQGVVKDFEDHSRSHARSEVAGLGKVVLGGLM